MRHLGLVVAIGILIALPAIAAQDHPTPEPRSIPLIGLTPATTNFTVGGHVFGSYGPGRTPVPLAGVEVTATAPDFSTAVATSLTNQTGAYSLEVPPGQYYVWSNQSGSWGGGGIPDRINVSAGNETVNLTAYPYLGYGNATFVLPGWNRLAAYLNRGNVMDGQQPILSWTQDGAFYVNSTDQLVFYSFPNGTVTEIAPWVALYENVMDYAGWENEEFITPDGSWVYGLGCLTSCTPTTHVTLYAVNVTTGKTVEHNWTTVEHAFEDNAQVNLVGERGNLSTAVLIDQHGNTSFYNLWNRTQWSGPTLPFFEANNIYWIPYLSSYVDVQAHGSPSDGIVQWELVGPGDGTGFASVFSSTYGSGFLTNAVTGPVFNVSSRALVFDAFSKGAWYTFEYSVTPGNVLNELTVLDAQSPGSSVYADEKLTLDITADEHRGSLVYNSTSFAGAFWPFFGNRSFVVNPFTQEFYETNQTPGVLYNLTYSPDQESASSDTVDGLFFNGSYLISPGAYDCDSGPCPIDGGGGYPNGTVWWLWQLGQPEFPTPVTAPLAQAWAPSGMLVTNSTTSTSVQLRWTTPTSGQYPLLNFTVAWGLAPGGYPNTTTVSSLARGYIITGLPPEVRVYFEVTAWNLHWSGSTGGSALLPEGPPIRPTDLHAVDITAKRLTLRWTPPPESVVNYTVFWGPQCGSPERRMNLSAAPSATFSGLLPETEYCFEIRAWNPYGSSPVTAGILVRTLGEVGARHLPPGPTIPYHPPAVEPSLPACGGFCFPSTPNPGELQFWAGAAVAAMGATTIATGRRAIGGVTLAVGLLVFFL